MTKIFEVSQEHYKILAEMIGADGKIISGAYPQKSSENSINNPNDEGYPPETTDVHMRLATQPPTAFRYGAFFTLGGIGGITEATLKEDNLVDTHKKSSDLINKPLSREDIISTFPLMGALFKELDSLTTNINEIGTLNYEDNIEQIKITFIRHFLTKLNYKIMPKQAKKIIFNSDNG